MSDFSDAPEFPTFGKNEPAADSATPLMDEDEAPRTTATAIAGLILAFLIPIIGLLLSIIALSQASKNGDKKGVAIAGVVVGLGFTILNIILTIFLVSNGLLVSSDGFAPA